MNDNDNEAELQAEADAIYNSMFPGGRDTRASAQDDADLAMLRDDARGALAFQDMLADPADPAPSDEIALLRCAAAGDEFDDDTWNQVIALLLRYPRPLLFAVPIPPAREEIAAGERRAA